MRHKRPQGFREMVCDKSTMSPSAVAPCVSFIFRLDFAAFVSVEIQARSMASWHLANGGTATNLCPAVQGLQSAGTFSVSRSLRHL